MSLTFKYNCRDEWMNILSGIFENKMEISGWKSILWATLSIERSFILPSLQIIRFAVEEDVMAKASYFITGRRHQGTLQVLPLKMLALNNITNLIHTKVSRKKHIISDVICTEACLFQCNVKISKEQRVFRFLQIKRECQKKRCTQIIFLWYG